MIKVGLFGKTYKVRFYGKEDGIYTITDKNGEHEVGLWKRVPMLDRYGKPKKTVAMFEGRPFYNVALPHLRYNKTDLANGLVLSYINHTTSAKA